MVLNVVGVSSDEGSASGILVSLQLLSRVQQFVGDDATYSTLILVAASPRRAVELTQQLRSTGYGATSKKAEIDELTKTFGANLGGQIMGMQRDFRGDFGGGGGPPWQGQPGQGQSQGSNRGGG